MLLFPFGFRVSLHSRMTICCCCKEKKFSLFSWFRLNCHLIHRKDFARKLFFFFSFIAEDFLVTFNLLVKRLSSRMTFCTRAWKLFLQSFSLLSLGDSHGAFNKQKREENQFVNRVSSIFVTLRLCTARKNVEKHTKSMSEKTLLAKRAWHNRSRLGAERN